MVSGLFAIRALVLHGCGTGFLPGDDELHDLRGTIADLKTEDIAHTLLKW